MVCGGESAYAVLKGVFSMGKKLTALLAVLCCLVVGLTACTGNVSISMDNSSKEPAMATNGGFVVETGNYVYFINGVESHSTTYKTGKVTKAALMRTKKSNFAKLGNDGLASGDCETVVSKLIVSGDRRLLHLRRLRLLCRSFGGKEQQRYGKERQAQLLPHQARRIGHFVQDRGQRFFERREIPLYLGGR